MHVIMYGCMVIVLAVHIHIYIYIYMIYDKTGILLNPFVGLLLGCKSSYTNVSPRIDCILDATIQLILIIFQIHNISVN